jgi:branched-chain amino acid transport system substrate-binding protein
MPDMRARTPRPAVAALLAAALATAVAACSGSESSGKPATVPEVKIGVLVPLTGTTKAAGEDALRGALLASEIINESTRTVPLPLATSAGLPNLGGAKVRLIRSDTKGDPTRAADELGRLVAQEGVAAVVGCYDAGVTLAASQRAERVQVPFMNGDASAGYLTERGLDWFFRVGPTDRKFGEGFFSVLKFQDNRGVPAKRIAVLYAADKSGNAVAADTTELAEEGGFTVVAKVPFDPNSDDLADPAGQVKTKNPDAVFVAASTVGAAGEVVEAFRRINYAPPAIMGFGPGFSDPSFIERAGNDAIGLLQEAAWSSDLASRNLAAKVTKDLFAKKYNTEMTDVSAGSFTAVMTMAQAINNAGSVNPERIRSALLSLDIPGRDTIVPWDGIRFDETNQNSGANGIVEQIVEHGDTFVHRVVYPLDVSKDAKLIWPLARARA